MELVQSQKIQGGKALLHKCLPWKTKRHSNKSHNLLLSNHRGNALLPWKQRIASRSRYIDNRPWNDEKNQHQNGNNNWHYSKGNPGRFDRALKLGWSDGCQQSSTQQQSEDDGYSGVDEDDVSKLWKWLDRGLCERYSCDDGGDCRADDGDADVSKCKACPPSSFLSIFL